MRKRLYEVGLRRVMFVQSHEVISGRVLPAAWRLVPDDEENATLKARIADGSLALVIAEEAIRTLQAFEAPEERVVHEDALAEVPWIEVTLVDGRGHPFPDTKMHVRTPEGRELEVVTDGRGVWRVDDLQETGTCRLALKTKPNPPDRGQTVKLVDDAPVVRVKGDSIGLRVGRAHQVVVARRRAMHSV